MKWSDTFVQLDKQLHDRASFNCCEPELNNYMQKHASRQMIAEVGHTLVLPSVEANSSGRKNICAFFTVAPSSLRRNDLPLRIAKKLPHYPIPVFLLAQLAVHTEYQGLSFQIICINSLRCRAFLLIFVKLPDGPGAFYWSLSCFLESQRSCYQKGCSEEEHGEVVGPEDVQTVAFQEKVPEDGHHVTHGVEDGEKPDNSRHVGYGKCEAGEKRCREDDEESAQHSLLLCAADC